MPYYCDHCKEMIVPEGFDYVVLIQTRPDGHREEFFLHPCCAKLDVLPKVGLDRCCEDHWLGSK